MNAITQIKKLLKMKVDPVAGAKNVAAVIPDLLRWDGSQKVIDLLAEPDELVAEHKKLFATPQAEMDAAIMATAFTVAEQTADYMSKMRLAAEHFRGHASFAEKTELSDAESRQDTFVVTRAFEDCQQYKVAPGAIMKWIACSFRLQAVRASAPLNTSK